MGRLNEANDVKTTLSQGMLFRTLKLAKTRSTK